MNTVKRIIFGTIVLVIAWIIFGVILFGIDDFSPAWSRGELGDFFGGGIGAIAIALLAYTAWVQQDQLDRQRIETFEAGVFRMFEALKPELEGISARIVSKAYRLKLCVLEQDFEVMNEKFRQDRTVFLREMQKANLQALISTKNFEDPELVTACTRFFDIMFMLDQSVLATKGHDKFDDFAKAIRSTEIFETYTSCFCGKHTKWKK